MLTGPAPAAPVAAVQACSDVALQDCWLTNAVTIKQCSSVVLVLLVLGVQQPACAAAAPTVDQKSDQLQTAALDQVPSRW
jgi:hypothetical protein